MRYLPLVWAAIMRKPVRAILTLLSVMIAFTLFGLTIGINATFAKVLKAAHSDRLYIHARMGGGMPLAMGGQLARLPGVSQVGYAGDLYGYHQDPNHRVFAMMVDDNFGRVISDWPVSPAQWDMIRKNHNGALISQTAAQAWHLKPGDNFTIAAPQVARADGKPWTLHILSVVGDLSYMPGGFMVGNYDYLNKSLPLARQDKVGRFFVQARDPARAAGMTRAIDNHFANSAVPTKSITEKVALDISNTGADIAAVDRDIALAGMFMVLFLTANGIAQSVRERFAEFATLKTIGFGDRGVMGLVVLEAAIPCLLGAIAGVGLAAWICTIAPHLFPPGQGVPMPTVTGEVFLWAAACAAAVAMLSSALPAMRLRRMDIATALSGR